jgi:hypothetical protein
MTKQKKMMRKIILRKKCYMLANPFAKKGGQA